MMLRATGSRIAAACVFMATTAGAWSQWTVTRLTPEGATGASARGASEGHEAGSVAFPATLHAGYWSGSAESWVDLHPAGASQSEAVATSGMDHVGYCYVAGDNHASLWRSGLWVDLHPAGATSSYAFAVDGEVQGGYSFFAGVKRAGIWFGSPQSWVSLHPSGASASSVAGISGDQQAGSAFIGGVERAGYWLGTSESWVSLHPAGAASSAAYAVRQGEQVGYAEVAGVRRAGVWHDTPGSWVDLHPLAALESYAHSTDGTYQVGMARFQTGERASLWSGSSQSWVDLHLLLPAGFSHSEAWGIWSDGMTLRVTGRGVSTLTGRSEAFLWTRVLCAPPEIAIQPMSVAACDGGSATLSVSATGTAPQFQWRKDEAILAGATDREYTIQPVTTSDAGSYDCIITNACGTATSNRATLTVRTPQILTQPASQAVNVDQPVFFALEADPQHPCFSALAYRWQRRNPLVEDDTAPNAWLDLSDGGGFAGTHSASLAIFRPTPGLATGYRCKITNACGCEADANGVIYTDTVNFTATCPSDFNNDGSVDGDDVIEFFERWDSGC